MAVQIPEHCTLCPRCCGADRRTEVGRCGAGNTLRAARAALHRWEEPCISGEDTARGSGTVFFCGCTLGCVFCQNGSISHGGEGQEITARRLSEIFLELQAQGAYNINLVTPTQYLPWIEEALRLCGDRLSVPVLYNTGGYEREETLRRLEGKIQIYPPDYFAVASLALREMFRQVGAVRFDENGILQSGMVVRHLVLPGAFRDSLRLLDWLAEEFDPETIRLSIMSQYTPPADIAIRELQRPVFTYEYRKVCEHAAEIGFLGYTQQRSSADAAYTPPFDGTGL